MDVWKDIKGFEGIYQVNEYGEVKSIERITFNNGTNTYNKIKEKILKKISDKNGYYRYCFFKDKKRYSVFAHRLVANCFIDNPNKKPQVNHIDGVKTNNHVSNLEWCTAKENTRHALDLGLSFQAPGENHHMSKLTNKEVFVIRSLYDKKQMTQKEISFLFNVSQTQISRIVNKKKWSHI
jgi:predicted XRE-type DNA-binding protein